MQKILQWNGSVRDYQAEFKKIEVEKPKRCRCGCVKFHKWGKYERYVIEEDGEHIVPVQRICCVQCRRTYSYLPSFCVSKMCYSADFVLKILSALILKVRFELEDMKRRAYAI